MSALFILGLVLSASALMMTFATLMLVAAVFLTGKNFEIFFGG